MVHQEGIEARKALLIGYVLRDHIQELADGIMPLDVETLLQPPTEGSTT